MNTSAAGLKMQWASPSDVTSILMIIGGDVVQKALAQGTGKVYTPVCFSFGCVAYAFVSLVSIIGDGRLLPPPDYPAKVFNLDSGYQRENKNWVVGRILRDLESYLSRTDPIGDHGMRISVFEATLNMNGPASFSWGRIHAAGALITVLQLALAVVPIVLDREWTVMMIVVAGTFMVQITGWLPQWRAEKLPNRQRSNTAYALTSGNGSRDVIVIFGRGYCLDLEELCASGSPRTSRPWEKFTLFSKPNTRNDGTQELLRRESRCRGSINAYGLPMGFWITKIMSGVLSVFWLLLLINVAAEKQHTWYLLGIGATGMFQNAWLAATETSSERHNLPLILIDTIKTQKVMDCLMDFQTSYQQARPLLKEFFPGRLRPLEEKWWYGQGDKDKDPYDAERRKDEIARGRPKRPVKNRFQPSSVMTHGSSSFRQSPRKYFSSGQIGHHEARTYTSSTDAT
ncbi:hypothetical protein J7T55_015454 [Diaporthe amygdali]|uniref:uncharacterized protein n=1 Tax=Phomopsis amygdali TaxID=1214568 RepID=UPI0022FEED21|nr:uncharacterized protein J7T55_015454 [Diaporthe amygdali]KAJ0120722.1 hypothetical protein J7T55_015454 [Diaporthe amygdali]